MKTKPTRFRWLTRLYPERFRERYEDEMLEVFEHDHRARSGRSERAGFWWRAVTGALRTAPQEHLTDLGSELRQVSRSMVRRPLLAVVSVLSMGLGMGAAATVFAALSSLFFSPIPGVEDQSRLINLKPFSEQAGGVQSASYPDLLDFRASLTSLEGIAAFTGRGLSVRTRDEADAQLMLTQIATPNFLNLLGTRPAQGRFFSAEESDSGVAVAFVSHWFWTQRLGAAPIVDQGLQEILVNGEPYQVIGVGPEGFRGIFKGFPSDVYLPLGVAGRLGLPDRADRSAGWLEVTARLAPNATLEQVSRQAETLAAQLSADHPLVHPDLEFQVERNTGLDADFRRGLLVFLSAMVLLCLLVLSIAVLNVAGMMSGRSFERREETAVRLALGAPLHRLARRVLIETSTLGIGAALFATLVMLALLPRLGSVFSVVDDRIQLELWVTPQVLVALAMATFGLAALIALGSNAGVGLRAAGRPGARVIGGGQAWRRTAVVLQVLLSFSVLTLAGLFVRALSAASEADLGFEPRGVMTSVLNPSLIQLEGPEATALLDRIASSVEELPQIEVAALATRVPLSLGARFFANRTLVQVPGWQPPEGAEGFSIEHSVVSEGYFETMGIGLLDGRGFDARERMREGASAAEPLSVVVNDAFRQRFFEDGEAVGRELQIEDRPALIVGVAVDSKLRTLQEQAAPALYLSYEQRQPRRAVLLARSRHDADAALGAVRSVQRRLAPELPPQEQGPLERMLGSSLLPQRVGAAVAGTLGLFGALLSSVGLYAILAQWVIARRREVGLRTALGAGPVAVAGLVLRQGAWLTLLGILCGLPVAFGLASLAGGFLFGVGAFEPNVYGWVAVGFFMGSLIACLVPSLRALRVSPLEALRAD